MPNLRAPVALSMSCVLLVSCGDGPTQTIADHCDPLVPEVCAFPFPSNRWLVPDPSMPSGRRVEFDPLVMPVSTGLVASSPEPFRHSDGFSPGNEFITYLPGMSIVGLADANHIADSLLPDSPTVIIDEDTGERIPHWAELDMRSDRPEQRALLIRPAVRLEDEHTYIVAVRHVADDAANLVPASPAFAALRDGGKFPHPSIRARRERYEAIFAALEAAGVERDSLQIAWDMSISSQENQSGRMRHVRDTGLAALGGQAPAFVIDAMSDNPQSGVARRIDGHVTVPLFLDTTALGGEAILDADGMPTQNGTADFPFVVLITDNAVTGAVDPVIQFGHGLFGKAGDVVRSDFVSLANSMGAVAVSVDWLGLTFADAAQIAFVVISGALERFATVPDRGQQAMLNAMYALRMTTGALPSHESTNIGGVPVFNPGAKYFVGNSLGGIYGSTYAALTPDIERAVLFVPGQPFSLLLPRSEAFDPFDVFLDDYFAEDARTAPYLLSLLQMLWDRVEPTGFSNHILEDPFPGSSSPDVLVVTAIGDPVVSTRAGHVLSRAMGLPNIAPLNREVFGLTETTGPINRAALLEVSFGLPPEAVTNISMPQSPNPHDMPLGTQRIRDIAQDFLETGVVTNACAGTCDPD